MNAQQRRKQYRSMPKVGVVVSFGIRKDGSTRTGVFAGPGESAEQRDIFGGKLPSLHRAMVITGVGSSCQPLLRKVRAA